MPSVPSRARMVNPVYYDTARKRPAVRALYLPPKGDEPNAACPVCNHEVGVRLGKAVNHRVGSSRQTAYPCPGSLMKVNDDRTDQ